jgi:hypothetical protein
VNTTQIQKANQPITATQLQLLLLQLAAYQEQNPRGVVNKDDGREGQQAAAQGFIAERHACLLASLDTPTYSGPVQHA